MIFRRSRRKPDILRKNEDGGQIPQQVACPNRPITVGNYFLFTAGVYPYGYLYFFFMSEISPLISASSRSNATIS